MGKDRSSGVFIGVLGPKKAEDVVLSLEPVDLDRFVDSDDRNGGET
jgi:hypothetical protein